VSVASFANGVNLGNWILARVNEGAEKIAINEIAAPYVGKIIECNQYLNADPARKAAVYGRLVYFVAHQETGAGSYNYATMQQAFLTSFEIGAAMAVEQYPRARWWCEGEAGGGYYTRDPYLLNYFLGNGYNNTWGQGSPLGAYGWSFLVALRNQHGYAAIPLWIVFG